MTTITLPVTTTAPPLLRDAEVAYDELLRLGALARALDPSLPPALRYFRRTAADPADRQSTPARVVLTHDTRPSLVDGLQDAQAVDLFDALSKTLPSSLLAALKGRVEAATAQPSSSGIVVQAFEAAHRAGRVELEVRPTNDPDQVIEASPPLSPPALSFRDDVFLAEVASSFLRRSRSPGEDPAFDSISNVNMIRQALSGDASKQSMSRINEVIETIRGLGRAKGEAQFEERTQQGWIAYSLLSGGKGWTKPLLTVGKDVAKPFTAYQGVSPLLAAVVQNDPVAVQALVDAGASPNAFLDEVPAIFGNRQDAIEGMVGQRATLAMVGAAVGSTEAVAQLLKQGAMVDIANTAGNTVLSVAVQDGNEPLTRLLLAQGADPRHVNRDGVAVIDQAQGALREVLKVGVNAAPAAEQPEWSIGAGAKRPGM